MYQLNLRPPPATRESLTCMLDYLEAHPEVKTIVYLVDYKVEHRFNGTMGLSNSNFFTLRRLLVILPKNLIPLK